jgi:hypothetical protein
MTCGQFKNPMGNDSFFRMEGVQLRMLRSRILMIYKFPEKLETHFHRRLVFQKAATLASGSSTF